MTMTKFADQVVQLTNLLSTYSQMASEVAPKTMYATVLNSDTVQIDGAESLSPLATNEAPGTKIQIQIRNHQIVRVDEKPKIVENAYDDTDLKDSISNVKDALTALVNDTSESQDSTQDLFDRLTDYLNRLVSDLDTSQEENDEIGELLDDLIDDLNDDLDEVKTLVEEVKSNVNEANDLAKAAYDGVYPITSEMRDLLGQLGNLADLDTAQKEEISATYEREGEYSQAKADFHYNNSKSASQWSQTLSAELNAWAKNDEQTQAAIKKAKDDLDAANSKLSTAQKAELEAEEKHKNMLKKYNVGYKLYLKAQTEGNADKIAAAKAIVDQASDLVYGAGCNKESFSRIETALNTLEEKLKGENATTETCADEIAAVRSALASYTGNTGSLYALLESRFNVAVVAAEVGTAVVGIHKVQSTTISQTSEEIKLAAKQSYVDDKINEASVSIKAEAIDTTIKTLKSDGSLAKGTLIHDYNGGTLVCKIGNTVGCLTNANGSFDIVDVSWKTSVNADGETVYTPTVADNAKARFDSTGLQLKTGEAFTNSGIDGMFFVGKSTVYPVTIAAKQSGARLSLTRSQLMKTYNADDKAWLNNYSFRPVSLVRYSTNHTNLCKLSAWNFNPSVTDDSKNSLNLSISRNGAKSIKEALSVNVYVQVLWVKCAITRIDTTDLPIDEDTTGNYGVEDVVNSSLSGYLRGSLNTATKTLTIVISE